MSHISFVRLVIILFTGFALFSSTHRELPLLGKIKLEIPEPSDFALAEDGSCMYIVSDRGRLFKTDSVGNILDRAKYKGADFEGVCVVGDEVFVVDETLRMILTFDADDLDLKDSRQYVYLGAMNRGWESLIFNERDSMFVAFTEKLPLLKFAFDEDLDQKAVTRVEGIREISSATYHDGSIWVLSDEDRTVYRMSDKSYKVKESWVIPVLNPEGILFTPKGEMWILSDDMNSIFRFEKPVK